MRLAAALALWLCTAAAPGRLDYLGVNLSGAEFGVPDEFRHAYPAGVPGTDYIFPTRAEIDGYAAAGFNIIRVPFAWERLQPAQGGPFDPAYLAGLDAVVRAAAAKRVTTAPAPPGSAAATPPHSPNASPIRRGTSRSRSINTTMPT